MSDINVNFTISQFNANLSVDPAPNVTMSVADPMTAMFYIAGDLPGQGTVTNVNTSGNSLGFSLTGGPITSNGTITLNIPTATDLRTSLNIGTVANINLNANASQVLAGNGGWIPVSSGSVTSVNTSGSGLGFSLGGGPITSTGTVALTIPTATDLRTNLNIGTVANINLNANGSQVLAGNGSWITQTSGANLSNVTNAYEAVTLHTTTSGTYNYDILNSSVAYSTANATGNITINFRGNATTTLASQVSAGKSVTAVYLMTTGTTGYIVVPVQIDGTNVTVRYAGGSGPGSGGIYPIANAIVSFTYTMIKTSDSPVTWTVLGSQTRY